MNRRSATAWAGECLRKKKLKESWADNIIERAKGEGTTLHKYYCCHCQNWHVTKMDSHKDRKRSEGI